ncbi:MAG: hypothetical protein P1V51_19335 [Deltaproteobacteria bacterium]|nr:hypothetical protein [Deltaproteobacteria bacterium]
MMNHRTLPRWLPACLATGLLALAQPVLAQDGAFVPSEYEEGIEAAHQAGDGEHVLTVQKITSQIENLNTGKITVASVTQLLDCKTGKLVTQSRCDPCEYNVAEWPKRPLDTWFVERSWAGGSHVAREQARMQMEHFTRYFKLAPADGVEHQGFTYAFWSFDGRRGTPLVRKQPKEIKVAKEIVETAKPEYGPVQKIEIFEGPNKPDEIDYPTDGGSLRFKAVAYAARTGQSELEPVESFSALWSASCATLSSTSAKEIIFTLKEDNERCKLHLYEGRTGAEDSVTVIRRQTKPKVRVAITYEGGKEADGIALTGNIKRVQLAAQAFDPAGAPLPGFEPEWGIECGKVEWLDEGSKRRLKLHLDDDVKRCEVRARDPESGAEDVFLIEVR